jgi:hypothetical protein
MCKSEEAMARSIYFFLYFSLLGDLMYLQYIHTNTNCTVSMREQLKKSQNYRILMISRLPIDC